MAEDQQQQKQGQIRQIRSRSTFEHLNLAGCCVRLILIWDRFTAPFFHIFSVLKMCENVGFDAKKRRIFKHFQNRKNVEKWRGETVPLI